MKTVSIIHWTCASVLAVSAIAAATIPDLVLTVVCFGVAVLNAYCGAKAWEKRK